MAGEIIILKSKRNDHPGENLEKEWNSNIPYYQVPSLGHLNYCIPKMKCQSPSFQ